MPEITRKEKEEIEKKEDVMRTKKFLKKVNELYDDSKKKSIEYVNEHLKPLSNGDHVKVFNNNYEIVSYKLLNDTILQRLPDDIKKWYNKKNLEVLDVVNELGKPKLTEDTYNVAGEFKHTYKPYKDFSEEVKANVEIVIGYIKEVWAHNDDDMKTYILKWLSNMAKGNKNTSCLYLRGPRRIGKSWLCVFIRDYVIGQALSLETGSGPLINKFNTSLMGKLFVYFEELENMNDGEWNKLNSTLKRQVTSERICIEGKGENVIETKNNNNYMILTNNDCLKDDDGDRYVNLDINTKYKGDDDYFIALGEKVYNDEVGRAFFCYLLELDTKGFKPQKPPMTKNKMDAMVKRLDGVYEFLKTYHVLPNVEIDKTVSDLYIDYKGSVEGKRRPYGKHEFVRKMREININYYKSNKSLRYKVSIDELKQIAVKNKWLHELDIEFCRADDMFDTGDDAKKDPLDEIVDVHQRYSMLLKQMDETRAEMEKLIDENHNKVIAKNKVKEISDKPEQQNEEDKESPTLMDFSDF